MRAYESFLMFVVSCLVSLCAICGCSGENPRDKSTRALLTRLSALRPISASDIPTGLDPKSEWSHAKALMTRQIQAIWDDAAVADVARVMSNRGHISRGLRSQWESLPAWIKAEIEGYVLGRALDSKDADALISLLLHTEYLRNGIWSRRFESILVDAFRPAYGTAATVLEVVFDETSDHAKKTAVYLVLRGAVGAQVPTMWRKASM